MDSREEALVRQELEETRSVREAGLRELRQPEASAPLEAWVRYALLKHPAVFASYSEWRASVAAITPAKALPDPRLTFQADIQSMVMSVMPGVMFDLMLPEKRAAMARELASGSLVAAKDYQVTVSRVAGEVQRLYVELAYVEAALRLREQQRHLLEQRAQLAAVEYQTGSGMGTLEAPIRLAADQEKLALERETLGDKRGALRAEFKAALGLQTAEPDPAWPQAELSLTVVPAEKDLWTWIQADNPGLGRMRAMVDMTVAQEQVAKEGRVPDFSLGLMTDVKTAPWMWRPTASMSLPVWRGKLEAQLVAAKARHEAAQAAAEAETLTMAAELSRMLYMLRESERMIHFIDERALPRLHQTVMSAEANARTGMSGNGMIAEGHGMMLAMQSERLAALREHELAVANLALMAARLNTQSGFQAVSVKPNKS